MPWKSNGRQLVMLDYVWLKRLTRKVQTEFFSSRLNVAFWARTESSSELSQHSKFAFGIIKVQQFLLFAGLSEHVWTVGTAALNEVSSGALYIANSRRILEVEALNRGILFKNIHVDKTFAHVACLSIFELLIAADFFTLHCGRDSVVQSFAIRDVVYGTNYACRKQRHT